MKKIISEIIANAYNEDMPQGDITSEILILPTQKSNAILIAKESGVIAGIEIFKQCFKYIDKNVKITVDCKDGDKVNKGDVIARINGSTVSMLKAERVALNILQRMSGIATTTNQLATIIKNTKAKIYDTRKTTPNLRVLEKMAVKLGGGENHRFSLSDMAMIKDNHINAAGSITNSINKIRKATKKPIAVEVENISQFKEALDAKPNIIMLDNMTTAMMEKCVKIKNKLKSNIELEATGNVTEKNILKVAKTGVDRISSGKLTHSYKSLDISLRFND